jgi:hypothetical protein
MKEPPDPGPNHPTSRGRPGRTTYPHQSSKDNFMTWFKIDDSFYDHPKVFDAPDCAVALWTRAGTWSARNLTDGFVPTGMPARFCDDPEQAVKELLNRGLWKRTRGGYQFHDWSHYQPTKEEALAGRDGMSSGGALGNHRRWHLGQGKKNASCRYCQGKQDRGTDRPPDQVGDGIPESPPNPPARPVPAPSGGRSSSSTHDRTRAAPSPLCSEHQEAPADGPCGRCADARRARERWDLADSNRRRNAEKCRSHRGQPADNCALCRSEALADQEAT